MKRTLSIIVVALILVSLFSFVGCAKEEPVIEQPVKEEAAEEVAEEVVEETAEEVEEVSLTGEIVAGGSTSVQKVAEALLAEFGAINPGVTTSYDATGSSTGVKNAASDAYMIGAASRNIKDSEKEEFKLDEAVLAYDGIAVAVNPANTVAELTVEQVQKIYKGEITDWSEVGGEAGKIVVVSREDGSGTRGAFEEIVDFEEALLADAVICEGNGAVATAVAGEANAIGYISFVTLEENSDTVKGLLIEGGNPTADEVVAGSYPISRPFMLVYKADALNEACAAFLEFAETEEGKAIIADKGAIPLS